MFVKGLFRQAARRDIPLIRRVGWLCFPLILFGCTEVDSPMRDQRKTGTNEGINASRLLELSGKRIYFGHQSVGYNILDGVREVLDGYPGVKLPITEFDGNGPGVEGRGILHSRIGKNGEPLGKIDSFRKIVLGATGRMGFDVAFFKFCYVDFNENTDVREIFDAYKKDAKEIQAARPGLVLVHMTVPLTSGKDSWKDWIRSKIRGKRLQSDGNVKRNLLNEMLRAEYKQRAPFFDLARYESTRQDGRRMVFIRDGREYEMLAEEYTDDGGHLNARGKSWIGKNLLLFLGGMP